MPCRLFADEGRGERRALPAAMVLGKDIPPRPNSGLLEVAEDTGHSPGAAEGAAQNLVIAGVRSIA